MADRSVKAATLHECADDFAIIGARSVLGNIDGILSLETMEQLFIGWEELMGAGRFDFGY